MASGRPCSSAGKRCGSGSSPTVSIEPLVAQAWSSFCVKVMSRFLNYACESVASDYKRLACQEVGGDHGHPHHGAEHDGQHHGGAAQVFRTTYQGVVVQGDG